MSLGEPGLGGGSDLLEALALKVQPAAPAADLLQDGRAMRGGDVEAWAAGMGNDRARLEEIRPFECQDSRHYFRSPVPGRKRSVGPGDDQMRALSQVVFGRSRLSAIDRPVIVGALATCRPPVQDDLDVLVTLEAFDEELI